jgi:hypothetical protein
MEGILIATGEPFRSHHTIHGAALTDLPTNLLYLLGCPIPTYMDGMIWEEAFLPGTLMNEPPQWSERAPSRSGSSTDRQDSADDAELHRRLKQLGYLS